MNHKASTSVPSKRSVISVHTKPEVSERLEILSAATRRSKSFLANEAIEQYLSTEESFIASVEEGIADVKAGRVMTTEELRTDLYAFINQQSAKLKTK
jgi:predicted transcriptional regulator